MGRFWASDVTSLMLFLVDMYHLSDITVTDQISTECRNPFSLIFVGPMTRMTDDGVKRSVCGVWAEAKGFHT